MEDNLQIPSSVFKSPAYWNIGGTLTEWQVYMQHHAKEFGGSVGTDEATMGVYGELECRINSLRSEMSKA